MSVLQQISGVIGWLDGWVPFLAPILCYCLPRMPRTKGRAKGRVLIALAVIAGFSMASYWLDWLIFNHITPPSLASALAILGRGPLSDPILSVMKSVVGFTPVLILYLRETGIDSRVSWK